MIVPTSLYRLQFKPSFPFGNAEKVLNYLDALGVTDIYASPVFQARADSEHGYDIVDPVQLNKQLGGESALDRLLGAARKKNIGWVQDIVPNHMAVDKNNHMLMDVLEKGRASEYVDIFDIHRDKSSQDEERVLLPVLGEFYGEALESGKINIFLEDDKLFAGYYDHRFPLNYYAYSYVLQKMSGGANEKEKNGHSLPALGADDRENKMPIGADFSSVSQRETDNFRQICALGEKAIESVEAVLKDLNGEEGDPESFNELDDILQKQYFRLAFWKVATEEINYRRFFSINDLISVRTERLPVFKLTHDLVFRLVEEKGITGLRIDHIDGLSAPYAYLKRLKDKAGDIWIVSEKILQRNEFTPKRWPIEGTTGYDLMARLNELFCDETREKELVRHYWRFTRRNWKYKELVAADKRLIIGKHMAGDIDNIAQIVKNIAEKTRSGRDFTLYGLRRALVEVAAYFPVYRTYIGDGRASLREKAYMEEAASLAIKKQPGLRYEISFLKDLMLSNPRVSHENFPSELAERFISRFQQYTGPLMAKGFEDTALYSYNRLISLNDVGCDPSEINADPEEFHRFISLRFKRSPHTMNTTCTHDTKRGEDVRARINVLSEIPTDWRKHAFRWKKYNRPRKIKVGDMAVPDANDEYFLYQTLLGSYPFNENRAGSEYSKRIKEYVVKSVREAKRYTAWIEPDEAYEKAYVTFVEKILSSRGKNKFLEDFKEFQERLAFYGMLNSLSQALLKFTLPGVPDIYQGCELWDFSLVDPDNRRDVDYCLREKMLKRVISGYENDREKFLEKTLSEYRNGQVKMFLTWRLLNLRRANKDLFSKGAYIPIRVEGRASDSVISFARCYQGRWILVVAGRLYTRITKEGKMPLGFDSWGDTFLKIPKKAPCEWIDVFSGSQVYASDRLELGKVFANFPVSVLEAESLGSTSP